MTKKNSPYFQDHTMELYEPFMPEESKGPCKKCKQIKILGDGYCTNCWDKTTVPARNYVEDKWFKRNLCNK